MRLQSLEILNAQGRISSVDVFRTFAIVPVVIYHFNGFFPFGYLGVDLFFVISGLLVGSILIRKYKGDEKIGFWRFILQRGFKIWPSYYWFLVFGTLLAFFFYRNINPGYIITADQKDFFRYIFFYQNYTGAPYHWPFDHVWSLCVEEHFYILLPIMFVALNNWGGGKSRKLRILFFAVGGLILAGIFFKIVSLYFTNSKDTYSGTHNRIDALGWGVLLGIVVNYYGDLLKKYTKGYMFFITGVLLFALNLLLVTFYSNVFFNKVIFHSAIPFCFFLMLMGLYFHDFSNWKIARFIAYYSYNWYLWHPIFVLIFTKHFGKSVIGLSIYLIVSFVTAVLFTILIEEYFLRKRNKVLTTLFKKDLRAVV